MKSEPQHTEVRTRVNAWVDEGVVPLVRALNRIPSVLTMASCEEDENGCAYVFFTDIRGADETVALAVALVAALADKPEHEREFSLEVSWEGGSEDSPLLRLECPRSRIELLSHVIADARKTVSAYAHRAGPSSRTARAALSARDKCAIFHSTIGSISWRRSDVQLADRDHRRLAAENLYAAEAIRAIVLDPEFPGRGPMTITRGQKELLADALARLDRIGKEQT